MSPRYDQLIERVFFDHWTEGIDSFEFRREALVEASKTLGIGLPKNIGDVVYTYRYRRPLPPAVREKAPSGRHWIIRPAGTSVYRFVAVAMAVIEPNAQLQVIKIPDATPGLIARYTLNDEQALLARIRYNRLIDVFARVTCYSLQSHLRTAVSELGQLETDEVYVGVDKGGVHYVLPVQAKGATDRLSVVQVEQDLALCEHKFQLSSLGRSAHSSWPTV